MWHRRVLYTAAYRAAMAYARDELHRLNIELQHEVAALRQELAEVRALFDELRSVSLARTRAEAEVAELHRLREIGRAQQAQHDPAAPLN